MFVYFGSQTGTAEGFARIVEKEGLTRGKIYNYYTVASLHIYNFINFIYPMISVLLFHDSFPIGYSYRQSSIFSYLGFNVKRVDLEDFDPSQLAESRLAVFLMATYGEGEHTDNATGFSNWMKNESEEERSNLLKDVSFTVFGLGNRQYEHFNQMGKRTNEALDKCGGKRVFDYGEGDDDGSLEDDFEKWKALMWDSLVSQFHPNAVAATVTSADSEKSVHLTYKLISAKSATPSTKTSPHKPFFQAKSVS